MGSSPTSRSSRPSPSKSSTVDAAAAERRRAGAVVLGDVGELAAAVVAEQRLPSTRGLPCASWLSAVDGMLPTYRSRSPSLSRSANTTPVPRAEICRLFCGVELELALLVAEEQVRPASRRCGRCRRRGRASRRRPRRPSRRRGRDAGRRAGRGRLRRRRRGRRTDTRPARPAQQEAATTTAEGPNNDQPATTPCDRSSTRSQTSSAAAGQVHKSLGRILS